MQRQVCRIAHAYSDILRGLVGRAELEHGVELGARARIGRLYACVRTLTDPSCHTSRHELQEKVSALYPSSMSNVTHGVS